MSYDRYNQRTTTTTRNTTNRRGASRFSPPPPPGSHNRQHSVLGYWVPLIALSTVAVGGLAAWIWSERSAHDEDDYPDEKPPRPATGMGGPYNPPAQGSQQQQQPYQPPPGGESSTYYNQSRSTEEHERTDQTFISRMSGLVKRTPSPQQFFDSASKSVAAAGAAAGAALNSIMEEDHSNGFTSYDDQGRHESSSRIERREEKEGFSDHERWSEEAEEIKRRNTIETESGKRIDAAKKEEGKAKGGKAKRTVAVVVSADIAATEEHSFDEDVYHTEHGVSTAPRPQPLNSPA